MYWTIETEDAILAVMLLVGLIKFLEWLPKKVSSTRGLVDYFVDKRKKVSTYVGILLIIAVFIAAPIGHFSSFFTSEVFSITSTSNNNTDISKVESLDPPNLSKLLNRNNSIELINYLHDTSSQGIYQNSWDYQTIRLDHEGDRDSNTIYCPGFNSEDLDLKAIKSTEEINEISINSFYSGSSENDILERITEDFNLPSYTATSVKYLADQPYESSKGLSFECKYNENIPWKISGSIHKEDTFEGGNAYFVNINIIRYVEI